MTEVFAALAQPAILIPLTAGLSIFGIVLGLTLAATLRQERVARIRAAAGKRDGALRPARGERGGNAGAEVMELIRGVVQRVNVMKDRQGQAMVQKLAGAGWRSRDALTLYLFGKIALPPVFAVLAAAWLFGVSDYGLSVGLRVGAVIAAGLLGSRLPELIVSNQTQRRRKSIQKALPDALDLLVICAEAGLSLDAALSRVAREIAPASPELADELGLTILELRFLPDRRRALENLGRRVNLQQVHALVNTFFQTEKFGTPLAQALRVLSHEMRSERMLRAEEKAARLPAIMTVPLIVFILPSLFVVLLGAAILDLGEVFTRLS